MRPSAAAQAARAQPESARARAYPPWPEAAPPRSPHRRCLSGADRSPQRGTFRIARRERARVSSDPSGGSKFDPDPQKRLDFFCSWSPTGGRAGLFTPGVPKPTWAPRKNGVISIWKFPTCRGPRKPSWCGDTGRTPFLACHWGERLTRDWPTSRFGPRDPPLGTRPPGRSGPPLDPGSGDPPGDTPDTPSREAGPAGPPIWTSGTPILDLRDPILDPPRPACKPIWVLLDPPPGPPWPGSPGPRNLGSDPRFGRFWTKIGQISDPPSGGVKSDENRGI